ncbi:major capsid protein [Crossiella sp. CA-258035]|uniref:major capsid protein n=1 Tax=Crossiella sp. CA-258035 TaxID=2981138 RepID=UPI0024BD07A6|nr:major capsid protein [Crossiella sp. CA-258035]WHT21017.1 major capsid protein [Crossiella sp. CA-258035]
MADIYSEYITPAELTGYARAALADRPENQFRLVDRLPHRQVDDLVYRWTVNNGGLAAAASFRAYDAEPKFGKREGIARKTGELPAIAQQYILGEYDSLRLRSAGEEIRNLLLRDAARIARAIDTRFEFARGQALVEGKVTLAEDGVMAEVDFGRTAAHSVAPATLWTDLTNAKPLSDLQSWRDTYVDTNGQTPGVLQTSTRVVSLMLRNAEIRSHLLPVGSTVSQVKLADLNALLIDFDLPQVEKYDVRAIDVNGASRRIIDDDKLLFLPPNGVELGATLWGTTLESQEPEYGIADGEHPGVVVAAFKQKQTPIRVYTMGSAIGIPLLADPNLSFVADVA